MPGPRVRDAALSPFCLLWFLAQLGVVELLEHGVQLVKSCSGSWAWARYSRALASTFFARWDRAWPASASTGLWLERGSTRNSACAPLARYTTHAQNDGQPKSFRTAATKAAGVILPGAQPIAGKTALESRERLHCTCAMCMRVLATSSRDVMRASAAKKVAPLGERGFGLHGQNPGVFGVGAGRACQRDNNARRTPFQENLSASKSTGVANADAMRGSSPQYLDSDCVMRTNMSASSAV